MVHITSVSARAETAVREIIRARTKAAIFFMFITSCILTCFFRLGTCIVYD